MLGGSSFNKILFIKKKNLSWGNEKRYRKTKDNINRSSKKWHVNYDLDRMDWQKRIYVDDPD